MIENVYKLLWRAESEQVEDVLSTLLEHEPDVRLVEQALFSEVRLADGLPNLFALAGATDKRPGLLNELLNLVARHICQACVGLCTDATYHLSSLNSATAN